MKAKYRWQNTKCKIERHFALCILPSVFCLLLPFLLIVAASGCKSPPAKPVPVKGKVVGSGGKSVSGALVTFWPLGREARVVSTLCNEDGSFSFDCPQGSYRVTVTPVKKGTTAAVPDANQAKDGAIPAAYQSSLKTPLVIEISEGGRDDVLFDLR
jgi:hypothetical protein